MDIFCSIVLYNGLRGYNWLKKIFKKFNFKTIQKLFKLFHIRPETSLTFGTLIPGKWKNTNPSSSISEKKICCFLRLSFFIKQFCSEFRFYLLHTFIQLLITFSLTILKYGHHISVTFNYILDMYLWNDTS